MHDLGGQNFEFSKNDTDIFGLILNYLNFELILLIYLFRLRLWLHPKVPTQTDSESGFDLGRGKRFGVALRTEGWFKTTTLMICAFCTKSLWLVSPMYWDERCATTEMSLNAKPGSRIICICLVSAPTLAKERLDIGRARCTMNILSGLACRERHMRIWRKWWRLVLLARMFYSFV